MEVIAGTVVVGGIEGWGPAQQTGDKTVGVVAAAAAVTEWVPVAASLDNTPAAVEVADLHRTPGAGQD